MKRSVKALKLWSTRTTAVDVSMMEDGWRMVGEGLQLDVQRWRTVRPLYSVGMDHCSPCLQRILSTSLEHADLDLSFLELVVHKSFTLLSSLYIHCEEIERKKLERPRTFFLLASVVSKRGGADVGPKAGFQVNQRWALQWSRANKLNPIYQETVILYFINVYLAFTS
jgi:hypothetical protein